MLFLTEEMLHKKSPQEITSLLYEACLTNLETAITAINEKNFAIANEKLVKAYDIVYRLDAGINYEAGIVADQLDAVYEYIAEKILNANVTKSIPPIEESMKLLKIIADAWNEALENNNNKAQAKPRNKALAYEKFSVYDS